MRFPELQAVLERHGPESRARMSGRGARNANGTAAARTHGPAACHLVPGLQLFAALAEELEGHDDGVWWVESSEPTLASRSALAPGGGFRRLHPPYNSIIASEREAN